MRIRVPNTDHAYYRASERLGWTRKHAKEMMKLANRYGKTFDHIKDKEISEFVKARQVGTRRRVKYYNGYIFVFASTSTRCYTVYEYGQDRENETTRVDY